MGRTFRYVEIAEAVRTSIDAGEVAPGALLPSEAELSALHEASRVTIRRALEELRSDGLIDSRQGLGWFVRSDPLRQSLDTLSTIERQLVDSGATSERKVLEFRFVTSRPQVAAALDADRVLEVVRLNLADGEPFAVITVWCEESVGAQLSRAEVERSSFLELLDIGHGSATQTIGATIAEAEVAEVLGVLEGSPLLRIERVTRDGDGSPVLVSEHLYPAHRTEFSIELEVASNADAPAGLKLLA